MSRNKFRLLLGIVLLLIGTVFLSADIYSRRHAEEGVLGISKQTSTSPVSIAVAQAVNTPQDGKQRVTVRVAATNNLGTEFLLSPGLQFWLEDTAGNTYPYTAVYTDPNAAVGGPIGAYQVMQLPLDFTLPIDATGTTLLFQPDASSDTLRIAL